MAKESTQPNRFRNQSLISWRAAVKEKELAQKDSKTVPRIDLLNQISQSLYQRVEVAGTKERERRASIEVKSRCIHVRTKPPRLRWEVIPAEKGMTPMGKKRGNFAPVRQLPQPCPVVGPLVREHDCFQLLPLTVPLTV